MKIQSHNNKINFSGIKVASVKVILQNNINDYNIYKVTEKDRNFLEKLYESTTLNEMYDNLTEYQYEVWNWVLEQAIKPKITNKNNVFIMANKNNIPCGTIKYTDNGYENKLNYVCTLPVEKNKKEPLTGKTLIMYMFKQLCEQKEHFKIELNALKLSAFNPIATYLHIGFKLSGQGNIHTEYMGINAQNVKKSIQKFSDKIQILNIDNQPEIDLFNELKV